MQGIAASEIDAGTGAFEIRCDLVLVPSHHRLPEHTVLQHKGDQADDLESVALPVLAAPARRLPQGDRLFPEPLVYRRTLPLRELRTHEIVALDQRLEARLVDRVSVRFVLFRPGEN